MKRTRQQLAREIVQVRGDVTRREFAARTGLTEVTLWRYETGRRLPGSTREVDALVAAGVNYAIILDALADHGRVILGAQA